MEVLLSIEGLSALATLVFLEIVLGIDNVIFISIAANRLPEKNRAKAWRFGLALALGIRVLMLLMITWIMEFNRPLFTAWETSFSIRDLILAAGGLFLIYKSTVEINHELDGDHEKEKESTKAANSVLTIILQIVLIDFVFSFDSILTAVGLSDVVIIMIAAVLISIAIMMVFLGAISNFIKRNPSMEVLALGFLILIGFILLLEAFHYDIPKGYIYFAVAFSFGIELINMKKRRKNRLAIVHPLFTKAKSTEPGVNESVEPIEHQPVYTPVVSETRPAR